MAASGSSSGVRAGRAYVELNVSDKLTKGLRAAQKKLQAFGEGVRALGMKFITFGGAVVAGLAATTKVFASMGDHLAKMSARTGISVEALSELGYAADQSGTDLDTLEASLRKMQKTIVDAATGSKGAIDALAMLGLTVEDLNSLSPEQQFKLIADRLSKISNPTVKAAAALELFGRSGTALLPMLSNGAAGIEELQEQARKLGLTVSGEDARAAEVFGDRLDDLWKVIKRGVFTIGSALVPLLQSTAEWITAVVVRVSAWLRQNRELVVTVFKVAAGMVAAGAALVALGAAASALGSVFGGVAALITGVGAALGVFGSILAALLTPIGMVITGLIALAGYFLWATEAGANALSWLGGKFEGLRDTAVAAWQGIGDALAAGDIGLAAKILWLTLKMEFQKGIATLQSAWLAFKHFFIDIGQKAFFGLLAASEIAWHLLQVGWIETVAFFKNLWHSFTAFISKTWTSVVGWVERRIHDVHGLVDSDFDAEEAKKISVANEEADVRDIENERDAAINRVENERQQKRNQEKAIHEREMGAIGKEYEDARKGLDTEAEKQRAESEASLTDARKEWQDALNEAAQKRQQKEAEDAAAPKAGARPEVDQFQFEGLEESLRNVERTIDVRGTFNPAAILGLQTDDSTAERAADAAEETAKNTKRLVDEVRRNALVFVAP